MVRNVSNEVDGGRNVKFKRERKMVKRIIMGNKKGVKTGLES